MEQCIPPFGLFYYNEDEGMMAEMRQYILQSRMELEATIIAAQGEMMKKEEEIIHIKDLLMMTIKERDEAQSKSDKLMVEKLLLQQKLQQKQQQPLSEISQQRQQKAAAAATLSNTNTTTNCFSSSSSECEESSIISSPQGGGANSPSSLQPLSLPPQMVAQLASNHHPLPEKGKLLKAVMEAGPLLQTLLLAGPLPQWQHPPPRLNSVDIPPVTITTSNSPRKRGLDNFDRSIMYSPKYQRVV
ncbi:uncharacterized protein LOC130804391 isoform X1 [Amaranthus tricolor]|uniref:uncharacterized protein LOC130804391 isoform X1 n=2 Tax=Amaranthus tricolor TaxID=29722 RepID=UPI00258CDCA8|nr:uncharacterized protein LOC130804391 isoform X1 [Amaranthus tricolor]